MNKPLIAIFAAVAATAIAVGSVLVSPGGDMVSAVPTTRIGIGVTIVVTTTTEPPPEGCPEAQYTPGGDDRLGGCFPGAHNTGPDPDEDLGNYTGPCDITVDDTVIDSMLIDNCPDEINIDALNVTISNSHIVFTSDGFGGGINLPDDDTASLTLEDSWIDQAQCSDCGVDGWNFAIIRSEITGGNRGAYCSHNCLIQDSWIHGTNLDPLGGAHASAARTEQFATIDHNSLSCDYVNPFPAEEAGCSANLTGYPDFQAVHDNTVTDNLIMANEAAAYCIYGGWNPGKPFNDEADNATNIVWQGNVFQRGESGQCAAFGATTSFKAGRTGNVCGDPAPGIQAADNIYDDGTLVTCDE